MDYSFAGVPVRLLTLSLTRRVVLVEIANRVRLFDLSLDKVLTSLQNILRRQIR